MIETASLFLAYRRFFPIEKRELETYEGAKGLLKVFERDMRAAALSGKLGLALSGGMDSAILANFLPPGSVCYTLTFPDDPGEFQAAKKYVPEGVKHRAVHVTKESYFRAADELMQKTHLPFVPHEPLIYLMAREAKNDGCQGFITGGGIAPHGEWEWLHKSNKREAFKAQLHRLFVDPKKALINPAPVEWVVDQYTTDGIVDTYAFLCEVGTEGHAQKTAIEAAGVTAILPYSVCKPLDPATKDGKPQIKELHWMFYGFEPAHKFALAAPYRKWFHGYKPHRPEFIKDSKFKGKRAALVYAVERWMDFETSGYHPV